MTRLLPLLGLALSLNAAHAAELKLVTWNLGWHLDRQEAAQWIAACDAPFKLEGATWVPAAAASADTRTGWDLPWGRNAPVQWDIGVLPPCNVFSVPGSAPGQFVALPVTPELYAQRSARIGTVIRDRIQPDVIALQEISGASATRELLGSGYEVCSYAGHKVQRLAIAWKKSLGEGRCEVAWPVSLPERALRDQVRPGLALTLTVEGKPFTVMTVHLKSSCVSPIDERRAEGRGQLDGEEPNCVSLQQQVAPLEAWIDGAARQAPGFALLGDFNRNLSHEKSEPAEAAVRAPNGRTRNLWRELADGEPAPLILLDPQCEGASGAVCALGKTQSLPREQMSALRAGDQLGCRNPLGLDHIVLGGQARSPGGAFKQALGRLGLTFAARGDQSAQLALSDHCPLAAVVQTP